MESHELIKALKEGIWLKHYIYYPAHCDDPPNVEYIGYNQQYRAFELKGWGSSLGSKNERLVDIIENPDSWLICTEEEMQHLKHLKAA